MSGFSILVAVIVSLAVAYQIYISCRVTRNRIYSDDQRIIQLVMIWLLPVIGASICHWIINDAEAGDGLGESHPADDGSGRQESEREGIGSNKDGE